MADVFDPDHALPPPGDPAPADAPRWEPRRRWAWYGAAVAAALGAAVFLLAPRGDVEAARARLATRALERAYEKGATPGAWQIQEAHGEPRKRSIQEDPSDPTRLHCRFDDAPASEAAAKKVFSFARSQVARSFLGEGPPHLFFENYRPVGSASVEVMNGRRTVRVAFVSVAASGPSVQRTTWTDEQSGDLVGLEDRAPDGGLVHAARLLGRLLEEFRATPVRAGERRSKGGQSLEEVVRLAPFPVYEPARLPPGFRRTHQAYVRQKIRGETSEPTSWFDFVRLKYSDGLAGLDVWIGRPDSLKRLDEWIAKWGGKSREAAACPSSPAATPEDLVADEAVVIRRRADKCRTVLRVDPVKGLTVELIGRNEIPADAYVTAIRSLARVPGSKDAPVEPAPEKAEGEPKDGDSPK
jgi:hypothetical protein